MPDGMDKLLVSVPVLTGLQKALKERGIDTMLEEAKQSSKESDVEHLKRP